MGFSLYEPEYSVCVGLLYCAPVGTQPRREIPSFVIRSALDCLGTYSAMYSHGPWNFLSVYFMSRRWYFVVEVVSAHLCFPQEHGVHVHGFAASHVSKLLIFFRLQDKNTKPDPPFTHKI
jgi:hypothetical protein